MRFGARLHAQSARPAASIQRMLTKLPKRRVQSRVAGSAQRFSHGVGVHSYSRVTWDLDGSHEAFRTRYAIDTRDANTRADVTVRILLDGKVVFEQAHVRAGILSPDCCCTAAGITT